MGTVAELDLSREREKEDDDDDLKLLSTSSATTSSEQQQKYPLSIVWCAIPILSDIFPFVGHVGITNSDGWIYDFIGDGTIHQSASNNLSFNRVMRVIPLNSINCKHPIDESLRRVMMHYTRTNERYNLFGQNCHDFVGIVLNLSEYEGKDDWNLVDVALLVWGVRGNGGSFVDPNAAYRTFGPAFAGVPGIGCVWFRESFRARGVRFVRSGSWMVRVVRVCVEQKKELFDTSRVNSVH